MHVVVADTGGYQWIADPDAMIAYVDHRLPLPAMAAAVAQATMALHAGPDCVPGARRLRRHLKPVPDD